MASGASSDIADPGLAAAGMARIGWARRSMPVLGLIGERFAAEQSLGGLTIAACLHVTAETAALVHVLRAGGARVFLAASNPLSTQDDIAAALVADGAAVVYARAGADRLTYDEHIHRALDGRPAQHAAYAASRVARSGARRVRVDHHRRDQVAPDSQ